MEKVVRNKRFGKEFKRIICNHRLSWTVVKFSKNNKNWPVSKYLADQF